MAEENRTARPTGKRQLTGASTTSADAYAEKRLVKEEKDEKWGGGVKTFIPEVIEQMRKVIWPSSKQMLNYTLIVFLFLICLLYTSPSPRDRTRSRMPSSA